MIKATRFLMLAVAFFACLSIPALAQTTGSVSGEVRDEKQAVIPNATVTVRNVKTNESRTVQTDGEGRYRLTNMSVGDYELTVDAQSFAKHVQSGITLALNQDAVVSISMKPAGLQGTVTVVENASLLNTTTSEVGTRFDDRRLSELPLSTNRNVYSVALSAPGVSQLNSGQSAFAGASTSFSVRRTCSLE